jgi:hypothetical protein
MIRFRARCCALASLALASAGLASAVPASAQTTLVDKAAGRPVAVSSTERPGLEAGRANDGNGTTRWGSSFTDGQWWQVDLGSPRAVSQVKVTWEVAYAARYRISTSTDGSTWSTAAEQTATTHGTLATTFASRSARFVRVTGLTRGTPWGISIWEAQVLGAPEGAAPAPAPAPTAPVPAGIPGPWTLKFADEFSGSAVDANRWTANWLGAPGQTTKPINGAELGAYAPSQATVSGGALKLTAVQQPTPAADGRTYGYRTGMVQSNGKFNFTYGAMEARIYSPATSDGRLLNWPAFWTDGQNWPVDGEIDVFEGLDGQAAWHYHYSGGGPGATVPGNFAGWHTFAAHWEPGRISFYYDGRFVGAQTAGVISQPHFLILNYGVGGWGGPISAPQTMQVDYVRVWQR